MDATLYDAKSSVPTKNLAFKFAVDAANAPTMLINPLNNYISGVVRTAQGIYTMTLTQAGLQLAGFWAELTLNAASALYAQAGPTTGFGASFNPAAPPTAVVFIFNAAGAAADPPAANPNVFVCGEIILCDVQKL